MDREVVLRDVRPEDLALFFKHQADPAGARMAASPSRERDAFMARWDKILRDWSVLERTVVHDGRVAGNIVSWVQEGRREVGYWLDPDHWGRGVASRALAMFLREVTERPLFAHVAKRNAASIRVLEKCGFVIEPKEASGPDGEAGDGDAHLMRLGADPFP